jgi:hypothetical protein
MRRTVPVLITGIVGVVFVVQYFIPHFPFSKMSDWFSDWFSIIAACAIWMGVLNLFKLSVQQIISRKGDWWYSVIIVGCIILMAVVGFSAGEAYNDNAAFSFLYNSVYNPLSSTMYAMLAFFVASASYRAFRAKNTEATILLVAAFIILLGRTALGVLLTNWIPAQLSVLQIPNLAIWIMNGPNLAGQRAIMIGISLGVISMSLRLLLGIERSYLGGDS